MLSERIHDLHGKWQEYQEYCAQHKPLSKTEYEKYIHELSPGGLVDHLRHFQSAHSKGTTTLLIGVGTMGGSILTMEFLDRMGIRGENYQMAGVLGNGLGLSIAYFGLYIKGRAKAALETITKEVENRLIPIKD